MYEGGDRVICCLQVPFVFDSNLPKEQKMKRTFILIGGLLILVLLAGCEPLIMAASPTTGDII